MLKKVEIINVGRFKNAKTIGDDQFFKKNTFIYGKNTYGKSTLTSIFRSLKENNIDYIVGRKTIGAQEQTIKIIPEVSIPVGEYRYTTNENKWNYIFKDIAIFDGNFVRENVYTQNQQIGSDQQKNIEAFMLGEKGVEYNSKISEITENIKENTNTQTSISGEYNRNRHLLGNLLFEAFLNITEITDIDNKIESNKKELEKLNNSELISNKLNSIKILLERYKNFDKTDISKNISVDSEIIVKHFEDHVNKNKDKKSYDEFLQDGYSFIKKEEPEHCPLCTQEIKTASAKEFLKTIDLIYNENYQKLQKAIKDAEKLFPQETFTIEIEKFREDLKQSGYLLEIDFTDIDGLFISCKKSIANKRDNLSENFDDTNFTEITNIAQNHIIEIETELDKFKDPLNSKIKIENKINELKANKERFSSWKDRCGKYIKAKKDNELLSSQKNTLWGEYLDYAKSLSGTMLKDINDILRACNCDFTITSFNFRGNQRQELFVLKIDNNEILNDGSDDKRTIKNCLSDSDKWILSLAFFLATIKNDDSIKIVVMDDPVSSFDSERKRIIMCEIKRILSSLDKQLILLTHEKGFYHLIYAENNSDSNSTFLKININDLKESDIISFNPNEDYEFMSDYNCWMSDMKNSLVSQDIRFVKDAHSKIRKVIEHILKTKYPFEITDDINTLGDMLTKLKEQGNPYEDETKRPDVNSLLVNLEHHDNSRIGQYPSAELGIEDFRKDIKDTFELMKKL